MKQKKIKRGRGNRWRDWEGVDCKGKKWREDEGGEGKGREGKGREGKAAGCEEGRAGARSQDKMTREEQSVRVVLVL